MPRGFLKHKAAVVGKKKSRGGGSGQCGQKHRRIAKAESAPKERRHQNLNYARHWNIYIPSYGDIHYKDIYDYGYDYLVYDGYCVHCEQQQLYCGGHIDVEDASETTNGFSLCGDETSSFSLVESMEMSVEMSDSDSEANSYSLCDDSTENSFSLCNGADALGAPLHQPHEICVEAPIPETLHCHCQCHFTEPARHEETIAPCFLCCEIKQVVKLMKNCRHPLACQDCLHQRYIVEAQMHSSNYPLKCFWPACERVLRDTQMRMITQDATELQQHFKKEQRAKWNRQCAIYCQLIGVTK